VNSRLARFVPLSIVRVCAAAGELSLAEEFAADTNLHIRRYACAYQAAMAMLAEAQGKFDTATALYEQAARAWREYGHVLETGYALLGASRCGNRRDERVSNDFQAAQELFTSLKAHP
jgi:hypothetical protein